jgi:RNA methyltransferase, TrmH family
MLSKTKVKYIQSLCHKKQREKEALFIAEGPKIVEEMILSPVINVQAVFATEDWVTGHHRLMQQLGEGLLTVITPAELESITALSTPHQVLALAHIPETPVFNTSKGITLILDGIQDPGNMGTLIRIADWFGLSQIVCSNDCVDVYNPKVVQASMGSLARLAVHYRELPEFLSAQPQIPVYAALLGGRPLHTLGAIADTAFLVIGNESKGIRPEITALPHEAVTIPRYGAAESLNAAVAAGILLSWMLKP